MECFLHCCDNTHDPIPLPDGQDVIVGRKPELKIKNGKCSRNQVQLTANYAEKEVLVKQLGKIPSSIANKEIKKGETALLGPGGMICLWKQQYPHFVYFKENPSVKNTPLRRAYNTSDASENTVSDLYDRHIVKKRKMKECESGEDYDKNYALYSANDVDLESKDEIYPVKKKSPSKCMDVEKMKKNVDGTKEIEDKCITRKRKMERNDGNDDNGNHHKMAKKPRMSSDDSKDLNIKDEQDVQSVCEDDNDDGGNHHKMAKKPRMSSDDSKDLNIKDKQDVQSVCEDDDDDGGNHHKMAKKAKMSSDDSKDLNIKDKQDMQSVCKDDDDDGGNHHEIAKKATMSSNDSIKDLNVKDEQDSKLACKDSKQMDNTKRTLASGSPCTTSTWEEIAQELLIYTRQGVEGRSKIAGFDMDGTLITTKSGKVFPTNAADWKIALPQIPGRLKHLWNDGYKIVIFTNQNGIAKKKVSVPDFKKKVENILGTLGVPIQVLISPGTGQYRKPSMGMWNHLCKKLNKGIDVSKEDSFYIGDAAGRPADWAPKKKKDFSCSDRAFAANIGIKFQTPEEFFLEKKPAPFNMPVFDPKSLKESGPLYTPSTADLVAKEQEVVLMVGFPAAGKSKFCLDHLIPHGYVRVNRDTLGSWQKCVKACRDALANGKSVVIDNTNPDKESRKRYIECARETKVPVRCFLMDVSREHAQHNNTVRETLNTDKNYKHVGTMVFNMYKSSYVEPSCNEGFSEILKINFRPNFKDERTKEFYNQYL